MKAVALVGFMASGKSTLGRRLAEALGRPFVDLDARVEEESASTIERIFEEEGEAGFRRREAQLLCRTLEEGSVIATGGGVVEDGQNRERLRRSATVIWIDAPFELIAERLQGAAGGRPLVERLGVQGLRELFERRRPLYEELADARVEMRAESSAERLLRELRDELARLEAAGEETGD